MITVFMCLTNACKLVIRREPYICIVVGSVQWTIRYISIKGDVIYVDIAIIVYRSCPGSAEGIIKRVCVWGGGGGDFSSHMSAIKL